MNQKKKRAKTPEEINFENELRKAKLQLEKGAHIQSKGNIPPEIESMFLDHIEKFDKAYRNAEPITVFKKIGSPNCKPVDEITEKGIKKELNSLMNKMVRKGLIVESICPVDAREMYRFITEELFKHTIDNISIKGMMTHFTYEEFHPNHEYDIKSVTENFLTNVFGRTEKLTDRLLSKKLKTAEGKLIPAENLIEKINFFKSFYSHFEINSLDLHKVRINKKITLAEVNYTLVSDFTIEGSSEKQSFSGTGRILLKRKWDFWSIYQLEIPGVVI